MALHIFRWFVFFEDSLRQFQVVLANFRNIVQTRTHAISTSVRFNIEDKKNCKVSDALLEVIDVAVTKNNKIRDSERLVLYLKYEGAVSEKDHRVYAIRSNSWCLRTL